MNFTIELLQLLVIAVAVFAMLMLGEVLIEVYRALRVNKPKAVPFFIYQGHCAMTNNERISFWRNRKNEND